MRKALATIIAERVDATNKKVTAKFASGGVDDDFNELMFDAGYNVDLLTKALGRVLVFDELMTELVKLMPKIDGTPELANLQTLYARARRDGA
jgi:hypothetical protein